MNFPVYLVFEPNENSTELDIFYECKDAKTLFNMGQGHQPHTRPPDVFEHYNDAMVEVKKRMDEKPFKFGQKKMCHCGVTVHTKKSPFLGIQEFPNQPTIELYTCNCGSTVAFKRLVK